MKYTPKIMTTLHSEPAFESAVYDAIPMGDQNDLPFLALEAYELLNEVNGQLDEAKVMEDKAERGEVLVDFVDQEIAGEDRVATPNEIALIEQATDAVVDGTGETVETVIPSLECFMLADKKHVALEGMTETISNFVKAGANLVSGAKESFKKFIKSLFSRLEALKNKVESIESKLSDAEFKPSVNVTASQSIPAAWNENTFVTDFSKAVAGFEKIAEKTTELSGPFAAKILTKHDEFVKYVVAVFKEARGRADEKVAARKEIGGKVLANMDQLNALLESTFKDGKSYGGLYTEFDSKYQKSDDIITASKSLVESVPEVYRAGNVDERPLEMTNFTKENARRLCQTIKRNINSLSKTKETDTMWAVDWLTDADFDLIEMIFQGVSSTQFISAINRVNRAYVSAYTRPLGAYINHFFRVAEAQLNLVNKAIK